MKARILRALGTVGTLLFASLFAFTFHRPEWVEEEAKDFITTQVEQQVGERLKGVARDDSSLLKRAAGELYRRNSAQIDELNSWLRSGFQERVAAALAPMRDLGCECRRRIAELLRTGLLTEVAWLTATNERLTEFIQGHYLRVVGELKRDLRIFTATNAAACLLLLFVSFARPRAIDHLIVPGALLAASVGVSSYFYAFEQNWLFTIVYSDYFGFAYLGLLTFVFGLLLDVFLNRGRITAQTGNWVLHAAGSTFSLLPC